MIETCGHISHCSLNCSSLQFSVHACVCLLHEGKDFLVRGKSTWDYVASKMGGQSRVSRQTSMMLLFETSFTAKSFLTVVGMVLRGMMPHSLRELFVCLLECDRFYRASYTSALYAVIACLSVRPSICLSVASRSCTKIAKPRITQTTPYDSTGTLVF